MKKKILYTAVVMVIIIGIIVGKMKGFNFESIYSNRQEMILTTKTELDMSKVKEIVQSVFGDKQIKVQEVERFGTSVQIIATEISDEEKQNIIDKINEEYNDDISSEDIKVMEVEHTKIKDIIKPYIIPGIITVIVILIYFLIMYNKLGIIKVGLKVILIPLITETTYYALIAITRIPLGRITNSIAVCLYVTSILILTLNFQKQKDAIKENKQKEND